MKFILILWIVSLAAACTPQRETAGPTVTERSISPTPSNPQTAIPADLQIEPTPTPEITETVSAFHSDLLGTVQKDQPYCLTPDGSPLLMDVYYPSEGIPPFPAVLYVHGGSWVMGDKSEAEQVPIHTDWVSGGNVLISINYRLAPEYKFPAQIEDVKCAVRSLRANASALGIDPARIAAMGSSAGGHLVSLLGTTDAGAGWDENGQYSGFSSRVCAVVDLFGPVVAEGTLTSADLDTLEQVFGTRNLEDPLIQKASPGANISPGDAPFLIVHGTLDTTVPLSQSQRFAELLRQAGVPAELLIVENAAHGLPAPDQPTEPSLDQVLTHIQAFLERADGRAAPGC